MGVDECVFVCACCKNTTRKIFNLQFKFKLRLITKPSFLIVRMNELLFIQ